MPKPDTIEDIGDGYTRFKGKFKVGDGPDQRAELTVEMVRSINDVDHDTMFGEYVLESDRVLDHAHKKLGLEPPDDSSPDDSEGEGK